MLFDFTNANTVRTVRKFSVLVAAIVFTLIFFAGAAYNLSFEFFSMRTTGKVVSLSKLEPACHGTVCRTLAIGKKNYYRYRAFLDVQFEDRHGTAFQTSRHLTEHDYDQYRHVSTIPVSYLPFMPDIAIAGDQSAELKEYLFLSFIFLVVAVLMWCAVYYYEYIASDAQILRDEENYRRRRFRFN